MSSEEVKKTWTAHLPGILTGSAALIAALTTVFINLRNDNKAVTPQVAQVTSVAAQSVAAPVASKPSGAAQSLELRLARLRIDNDGTMGSTDWTFDIQSNGRSLFSVPFKTLTDKAGANLVSPSDPAMARAVLATNKSSTIIVQGWKQGWIGKASVPDVVGQARLNPDDGSLVIEAKSDKANGPAFVLYFDARLQKTN